MTPPLRLMLIGSRPPPLGGTTVLFDQLAGALQLRDDVDLTLVDTSPVPGEGSQRRAGRLLRSFVAGLRRAELVSVHASPPGLVWFGALVRAACAMARVPLVIRVFGGSLDQELPAFPAVARTLLRFALGADKVLVETEQVRSHFAARIPAIRIASHPNSRPMPDQIPIRRGRGARRFVFVGHVRPSKGIRELVEASDRLPGVNARVDVIGPLANGITESVFEGRTGARWLGLLAPEQVALALSRADALVLPTWHPGEGHPGVILEAFAAGLPVVATAWRAIPEIVEHEVSGLLVEPGNAVRLGDAMIRLAEDGPLWERLAAGARAAAVRFGADAASDRFVALCRELARPGIGRSR